MRKSERGASLVPVVIIILILALVAGVWAGIMYSELEGREGVRAKMIAAVKAADIEADRRTEVLLHAQKVGDVVGYLVEVDTDTKKTDYGTDDARVGAWLLGSINSMNDKYVRQFKTGTYTVDEVNGGIKREETGDTITIGYVNVGSLPNANDATVENLYNHMIGAMDRMLNDVTRLVEKVETEKSRFATAQTEHEAVLAEKNQMIEQLRGDHNSYVSQAATRERDLQDENLKLEERKRQAEFDLEEFQKQAREREGQMKNSLLAKEQEVRKLIKRRTSSQTPIGPDGEVLAVTEAGGLVVLSRGKADHLMPGTTFSVFNYGKGAQKIQKGTVKVLEVNDRTAVARVIETMSPLNPIVDGDMFESATYNPDEVLHFYLLGQFRTYGRSDAARRLEQIGVKVDANVSVDTDYLVIGAPVREDENLQDTEAYKLAKELGITVITEAQLSRFLLY